MGIFFGIAKISNIFMGCLKFLIFFGWTVDTGPEPTHEEKMRVPPWGCVVPQKILMVEIKTLKLTLCFLSSP